MQIYELCAQVVGVGGENKIRTSWCSVEKVTIHIIASCHPWAHRTLIFTHHHTHPPAWIIIFHLESSLEFLFFSFHHWLLKMLPYKQKMTSYLIHGAVLCPENSGRSWFLFKSRENPLVTFPTWSCDPLKQVTPLTLEREGVFTALQVKLHEPQSKGRENYLKPSKIIGQKQF